MSNVSELEATTETELFPWKIQLNDDRDEYTPEIEIKPTGTSLYVMVGKIEIKIEQHPENGVVEIEAYDKETCSQDLGQLLLFQRDVEE